jgi:hypothetical protein
VSAARDAFDLAIVRERLVRFLGAQGLAKIEVERLRRFTVGFSWITFGFHARWRASGVPVPQVSPHTCRRS